jgi:hypothetical protein
MADRSIILRSFNVHFADFFKDILLIFPNNSEIKQGLSSFEMIKRLNPSIVVKVWYSRIYVPYKSVIEEGNLSFFFDKNYMEDLDNVSNAVDIMKIIDNLREPISSMNDINKQHTMKYIQNLSELSKLYDELKS